MMDIVNVLLEKLRTRMMDTTNAMAAGMCTDFAEYKLLCGRLEGLAHAERDLLDLKDHMEKNDE